MSEDEEAAEPTPDDPMVFEVDVPAHEWRYLLETGRAANLIADVARKATAGGEWLWPVAWIREGPPADTG